MGSPIAFLTTQWRCRLPPGTRVPAVCRITTLAEPGCSGCPPTSLLPESGSPRPTLSGAGAPTSDGPHACVRQAPRTEAGNWDGDQTPQLPLSPYRGSLYILPSPSPPKFVWGRGAQEAGSPPPPFTQFSSPSSRQEPRWEESSSSLPPAGAFRLSVLKSSHSAWRPPALKRVALCSGRLPSAFPLPALSIPLNGHSQGGWHSGVGQGTSTVCSTPSPGTASSG